MQRLEGQGANEGTLPSTPKCAGHTGTHLQSYRCEPGTPEVTEANRDTAGKYLKGIKGCSSRKVMQPTTRPRCLYTKACSMGHKQELEATMLQESYDPVAITETWWDKL